MTPRQKTLSDVLNHIYTKELPFTNESVMDAMSYVFYIHKEKITQKYIKGLTYRTEIKFITEVLRWCERGIVLEYCDFTPGGEYYKRKKKKKLRNDKTRL